MSPTFAATLLLTASLTSAPQSTVETRAYVPPEHDGCLDHTVRELGMSAVRDGTARSWKIAPQFLHSALVPDGAVQVRFEKGTTGTEVIVRATWPGGAKPPEAQSEIEQRLHAMAFKMAQSCGVAKPEPTCHWSPAGAKPQACRHAP